MSTTEAPVPAVAQAGPHEVRTEDLEYLRHGDEPLLARLYRPVGAGPFPAVVDAHGGAWIQGSYVNNEPINHAVAAGGVIVLSVDYRVPPQGTYPSSVTDINYAIRWLKQQVGRWQGRADWVGVMGTSSGGHLAALSAMKPRDARYAALSLAGGGAVDATVPFVVSLWPVICPISRYRENQRRQASGEAHHSGRVGGSPEQMRYWLTEEAMDEGSPLKALLRGDTVDLPPMLYVQALCDTLHPRSNMDDFMAAYRRAGGEVEAELVEGEPYDLVRSRPESHASRKAIARIVEFIRQRAA